MEDKRTYCSVIEACHHLGDITSPTLYTIIKRGDLKTYKIGRRRYVTRESLERYIERQKKTSLRELVGRRRGRG